MTTTNPVYSTYSEYLRLPEFRVLCKIATEAAGGLCRVCRTRRVTEVHHRVYPAWGYLDRLENLLPVCHECHCQIERKER